MEGMRTSNTDSQKVERNNWILTLKDKKKKPANHGYQIALKICFFPVKLNEKYGNFIEQSGNLAVNKISEALTVGADIKWKSKKAFTQQ